MSVHIQPTEDDNQFLVNEKLVRLDMDGIWKENPGLTPTELRYFADYLNMLNVTNLPRFTATYTT